MKKMTYLLNLTLIVVCAQFLFADADTNGNGKQSYISFEDVQATLPDKEFYEADHSSNSGDSRSAPDWEDDPGGYEFVATMTAAVYNDGTQLSDTNDILAAFDDEGTVRGISFALDVVFGPYAGTVVHEVTLRSNDEGDHMTFKFYDASEDAVLDICN